MSNENTTVAMGWDDVIENENDFILLPEGEYDFTVVNFERSYHNGSEKLPACPKAEITLEIKTAQGTASVKTNLFISRKTEGLLCAFFISIGQKKHGEPLKMNWNAVFGAKGRCKLGIREYNGNQYNEVKKFLKPLSRPATGSF